MNSQGLDSNNERKSVSFKDLGRGKKILITLLILAMISIFSTVFIVLYMAEVDIVRAAKLYPEYVAAIFAVCGILTIWMLLYVINLASQGRVNWLTALSSKFKGPLRFVKYFTHAISALLLMLLLLLGTVSGVIFATSYPGYNALINGGKEPYLTWTRDPDTTITITWESARSISTWAEYRIKGAGDDQPFTRVDNIDGIPTSTLSKMHSITITGLKSDTEYEYRVSGYSKTYSFRTAASASVNPTVRFIVYGDNRYTDSIIAGPLANTEWGGDCKHEEIVAKILSDQSRNGELDFNFTINVGDVVYKGDYLSHWGRFHQEIAPLASSRPYMIAVGNHEYYGIDDVECDEFRHFWTYSNSSGDETYYKFEIGNALFIVLNTRVNGTLSPEEVSWAESVLQAESGNYDWIFTATHYPIHSLKKTNENLSNSLEKLINEYGVDVHLSGHVHDYQRLTLQNYTHIVTGGGGAGVGHAYYNETDFKAIGIHHYQVWELSGTTAHCQTIALNGTVIDDFTLTT